MTSLLTAATAAVLTMTVVAPAAPDVVLVEPRLARVETTSNFGTTTSQSRTTVRATSHKEVRLTSTATASTPSVSSTREARMSTKLRDIAELRPGWWGPGSRAIDQVAIDTVRRALVRFSDSPVHVAIAPTADGSLMLEWVNGATECTAELHGGQMTLTIDNPEFDVYVERQVKCSAPALADFYITTALADDL